MKSYFYTYLISNIKKQKFYIGSRRCSIHPLFDIGIRYFSSSSNKEFIIDQKKNPQDYEYMILGVFSNKEDMLSDEIYLHESYGVDIHPSFYNLSKQTSSGFTSVGKATAVDKDGNVFLADLSDKRWESGGISGVNKNTITTIDKDGNYFQVSVSDPRYVSGELKHILPIVNKNTVLVKDNNGNRFRVSTDDTRYTSGEFVVVWKNRKHKEESKLKIGRANSINQSGQRNSQYGTMWICNIELQENRKIAKIDAIPDGWVKGRNRWKQSKVEI